MNALVSGEELGRLLRPEAPISRVTIWSWTCAGRIPKAAVFYVGKRIRYRVPVLIAQGWLLPGNGEAGAQPKTVDGQHN